MKHSQKDTEKLIWDQMRCPTINVVGPTTTQTRGLLPKLMLWLILSVSVTYVFYTLKLVSTNNPNSCSTATDDNPFSTVTTTSRHHRHHHYHRLKSTSLSLSQPNSSSHINSTKNVQLVIPEQTPTNISHIVFGIGASAKLWEQRKNYIKIWYNPPQTRGFVWLEDKVETHNDDHNLPEIKISGDTTKFPYTNRQGHRSALRISRIVSETLRLGLKDVRWFVLGDDDTVFLTENLVRVLQKYDHNQYYYIGSNSESHLQNIYFSYSMAYGGGGFAISYPLALALEKMQDRCIQRYPALYGSDDRIQACMSELGVPLTKELGFHQYDVYGNLFGLLAAHPVTPLVTLHHLDVVEPIFPNMTRVQALKQLTVPMKLDSAGLMQQSICYEKKRKWTVSVSWGFAVQIVRGILSPREMEMPTRTFLNWYRRADYTAYAFNTRPVARNPCQKPFVFYLSEARLDSEKNKTVSKYLRHHEPHPLCRWRMEEPSTIDKVVVYKKPDPQLWARSARRNCCRIQNSRKKGSMVIDVGVCRTAEVTEL